MEKFSVLFSLEILKNCIFNEKFYPYFHRIGAIFSNFWKMAGDLPPPPPSSPHFPHLVTDVKPAKGSQNVSSKTVSWRNIFLKGKLKNLVLCYRSNVHSHKKNAKCFLLLLVWCWKLVMFCTFIIVSTLSCMLCMMNELERGKSIVW